MQMRPTTRPRAFTLIELMVTIAVIAAVTAGVVVGSGAVMQSRVRGASSMMAGARRRPVPHRGAAGQ